MDKRVCRWVSVFSVAGSMCDLPLPATNAKSMEHELERKTEFIKNRERQEKIE